MNSTIKYNDISNEISEWEYSLENEIYLTVEEVEKGERIDGFLDFAIQAKFAYVNKLRVILPERKNGSLSMTRKC